MITSHPRRHVVLGHRRQPRRAIEHAHGAGDLSARRRARTARLLSGLPLPDIRGDDGDVFYYFGTDLSRYEEGNTEFGGILQTASSSTATSRRPSWSARPTRSSASSCASARARRRR